MSRTNTYQIIKTTTKGVFGSVVDLTLYFIFLQGAMLGKVTSRGVYQAFDEAHQALDEVNFHTISRSLTQLRKRGLLKTNVPPKTKYHHFELTTLGKERLESFLPKYQADRPWDQILRLISYDIPTTHNTKRDLLRKTLTRLGAGKIQESLWVIPYDLKSLLREEIKNNHIPGNILISELGQDGSIGHLPLKEMINQVYRLDQLNARYEQFIKDHKDNRDSFSLNYQYLSILSDDPQLPFELLPDNFLGEKAWQIYQSRQHS